MLKADLQIPGHYSETDQNHMIVDRESDQKESSVFAKQLQENGGDELEKIQNINAQLSWKNSDTLTFLDYMFILLL